MGRGRNTIIEFAAVLGHGRGSAAAQARRDASEKQALVEQELLSLSQINTGTWVDVSACLQKLYELEVTPGSEHYLRLITTLLTTLEEETDFGLASNYKLSVKLRSLLALATDEFLAEGGRPGTEAYTQAVKTGIIPITDLAEAVTEIFNEGRERKISHLDDLTSALASRLCASDWGTIKEDDVGSLFFKSAEEDIALAMSNTVFDAEPRRIQALAPFVEALASRLKKGFGSDREHQALANLIQQRGDDKAVSAVLAPLTTALSLSRERERACP